MIDRQAARAAFITFCQNCGDQSDGISLALDDAGEFTDATAALWFSIYENGWVGHMISSNAPEQ
jgi:hypothetical protein